MRDVMSATVISVDENTDLNEVVHMMEGKRIKRVPVLNNRQVVGIISRANLMRVLATMEPIDEEFPDVDAGLLPLDDIEL